MIPTRSVFTQFRCFLSVERAASCRLCVLFLSKCPLNLMQKYLVRSSLQHPSNCRYTVIAFLISLFFITILLCLVGADAQQKKGKLPAGPFRSFSIFIFQDSPSSIVSSSRHLKKLTPSYVSDLWSLTQSNNECRPQPLPCHEQRGQASAPQTPEHLSSARTEWAAWPGS